MAAIVTLIPETSITGLTTFTQDIDTVVDVSGYTEAWFRVGITNGTVSTNQSAQVVLQHSLDNYDDEYGDLAELENVVGATGFDEKQVTYHYVGPGDAGGQVAKAPGFGRYTRIKVVVEDSDRLTVSVKGLFR